MHTPYPNIERVKSLLRSLTHVSLQHYWRWRRSNKFSLRDSLVVITLEKLTVLCICDNNASFTPCRLRMTSRSVLGTRRLFIQWVGYLACVRLAKRTCVQGLSTQQHRVLISGRVHVKVHNKIEATRRGPAICTLPFFVLAYQVMQ